MANWLRNNVYASVILLVVRLYVGYEFLTAGWHKISDGFSAQKFLENAINKPVMVSGSKTELMYPTFTSFLNGFALPNIDLINVMVPYGEFLIGVGLILGTLTTAAMFFGMMMNFMFMFAGTVSSNPFLILLGMFIIFAGYNAGRFGGDRFVIPWLRNRIPFLKKLNDNGQISM